MQPLPRQTSSAFQPPSEHIQNNVLVLFFRQGCSFGSNRHSDRHVNGGGSGPPIRESLGHETNAFSSRSFRAAAGDGRIDDPDRKANGGADVPAGRSGLPAGLWSNQLHRVPIRLDRTVPAVSQRPRRDVFDQSVFRWKSAKSSAPGTALSAYLLTPRRLRHLDHFAVFQ